MGALQAPESLLSQETYPYEIMIFKIQHQQQPTTKLVECL